MTRRIVHAVLGVAFVSATLATAAPPKEDKKNPWWMRTLGIDLEVPFDAKEMDRLVKSAPGARNVGTLKSAIMQVTAQKDARFRGLIGRQDLRKRRDLDLALCGYDYVINGNEKAFARLMALDAEQKLGGDYVSIAVMGMIDEWDRTIESVWRHKRHSGGTAGTTISMFLESRKYLFPESYAKFSKSINTKRKLIERLASTVADDPKLNHDRGTCYRFYEVSEEIHRISRPKTGYCVKELPRKGADSLIFVTIGPGQSLETKPQRNWVLAPITVKGGGPRTWKDVTDEVFPGEEYKSMYMSARRKDNVIETGPIVFNDERGAHFDGRGVDLVWEGGKFLVRKQDGEKYSGFSRDPYTPSR